MAIPTGLHIVCGSFSTTVAECSSHDTCNRDHMTHKVTNILVSVSLQKKFASLWSMPVKAVSETEYLQLISQYLPSAFCAISQVQWNHCVIHKRYGQNRKHGVVYRHSIRCGKIKTDVVPNRHLAKKKAYNV